MRPSDCANTKTKDSEAAKIGRPTDNHIRAHWHTGASLQHGWKYCVVEGRERQRQRRRQKQIPAQKLERDTVWSECQNATIVTGANS